MIEWHFLNTALAYIATSNQEYIRIQDKKLHWNQ